MVREELKRAGTGRPGAEVLFMMLARLVALDEGPDIPLNRTMVVVGRHPQCDARLESLRVSRHHCCMTQDNGEVVVRDLGSTNGVRINGLRVEVGRLRPGDELSIAHIRYRLESGNGHDRTIAEVGSGPPSPSVLIGPEGNGPARSPSQPPAWMPNPVPDDPIDHPLAAVVREYLPAELAEKCQIQVIVKLNHPNGEVAEAPAACRHDSSPSD